MTIDSEKIRIGTRSSQLARWQADHVAARLAEVGVEVEIVFIETTGDLDRVRDFGSLGVKGVFVKEIETALLERRIDLAVHSLKDVPTELPAGLVLGAFLERERPYDALISRGGERLSELASGATLATGSLRRASQILALRPDLKVVPLRGNVPTRIRKIREGEADATLLAVAGLRRLGLEGEAAEEFNPGEVTPSMGQGAVAIECRAGEFESTLEAIDHAATRKAVEAERLFISRIGGGCKTPVGVLVEPAEAGGWIMTATLASADGKSLIRRERTIENDDELATIPPEQAEAMLAGADEAILSTLERPAESGPASPSR